MSTTGRNGLRGALRSIRRDAPLRALGPDAREMGVDLTRTVYCRSEEHLHDICSQTTLQTV